MTDATLDKLGKLLNIPNLGGEDWDLMCADPDRVSAFCDIYEQGSLNAPEKTALMKLIVASYDRYLWEADSQPDLENRLFGLLKQDFELHEYTIEYWSKTHIPGMLRAVSPLMLKVLKAE